VFGLTTRVQSCSYFAYQRLCGHLPDERNERPSFFNTYYSNGMELGAHLVHHDCSLMDERTFRGEVEPNIAGLCATTIQPCADVISFAFPCGTANDESQATAADYFLINRDTTSINWRIQAPMSQCL